MKHIKYRKGYKYQLAEKCRIQTDIIQVSRIKEQFIELDETGLLTIPSGYAWDGPSGPMLDTANAMRGSLVHDALYQLMRMGLIDQSWRHAADELFRRICLEDGMSTFRAWYAFTGVDLFAAGAASADARKKIITAP
ncbi:MAG: DUF1353 domain-containing protein [Candidatus Brocadiales bacterium]|nr:DUF1353 domain-containing protein [Candidatus Bathyanammoxibius sp.]